MKPFEATEDGDTTVLDSGVTRVRVAPDGSVVIDAHPLVETAEEAAAGTWRDDWRLVRRERPPVLVGETWTATVELEPDDQVHGLGERAAPLNLRPGTYGLWNTEQSGSYGPEADPLYITIPVHLVVGPGRAHLGFWENTHQRHGHDRRHAVGHLRGGRPADLRGAGAARSGPRAVP